MTTNQDIFEEATTAGWVRRRFDSWRRQNHSVTLIRDKHPSLPLILGLALTAGIAAAQTVEMDRAPLAVAAGGQISVKWKTAREAGVAIQVLDAAGRPLRTIDAGRMAAGEHTTMIDGKTLSPGRYTLRVGIDPTVSADLTFGVKGMLGVLSKKVMFKGDRKITLDVRGANPAGVTVKVEGEEWAQVKDPATTGNNYVFDAATGTVELNAAAPLDEGAEIAVTYPAGNVFENPWSVRAAPDGSLYIGDLKAAPGKSLLYKVDASGKPVAGFGVAGILELAARDLAVDKDGTIYVVTGEHHVAVRGPKGENKYAVAGYINPYRTGEHLYEGGYWNVSIALNADKRMVIVTGNNSNVMYDATKPNFDGYLAIQNLKEGAINPPVYGRAMGPCVAMTGDVYYATTCWNSLVKYHFDAAKKQFSTVWSTPVREDGQMPTGADNLFHGLGVELDGSGLIYVADRVNHRIQIFFDAGDTYKHVGSIGSIGTDVAKGQMMAPHALSFSPDGKSLYVADDGVFYLLAQSFFVKGLARVTKLKLGFQEVIELPLEVK